MKCILIALPSAGSTHRLHAGSTSVGEFRLHGSPYWRSPSTAWVTAEEQNLKLVGSQDSSIFPVAIWGPPLEFSRRQSFVAKPKSLAVVNEQLDGGLTAVAKNEHRAVQWVLAKMLATECTKPVDSAPEVRRLYRDEDPHLGRYRQHGAPTNAATRPFTSTLSIDARIIIVVPSTRLTSTMSPSSSMFGLGSGSGSGFAICT